jgi:predicted small secreted protein
VKEMRDCPIAETSMFSQFDFRTGIKTMKNYIIIALIGAFALAAVACKNTARGIGKDTENVGEKIQEKTR